MGPSPRPIQTEHGNSSRKNELNMETTIEEAAPSYIWYTASLNTSLQLFSLSDSYSDKFTVITYDSCIEGCKEHRGARI